MRYVNRVTAAASVLVVAIIVAGAAHVKTERQLYLPDGAITAENLIPAPPAIGTPEFEAEMATVLYLQQVRTPENVAFVDQPLNFARFAPILGTDLDAVDIKLLDGVLDKAINRVRADYDAVKARYNLPRPHQVSDVVDPVGEARPVASYPSGHTIRATVYARLLAEIFPGYEAELSDLAQRVGHGRIVAGQHYPMDVASGQTLGHAYADVIIQQSAFQTAVSQIRGTGA